jgi:hypothetical protein
MKLVSKYELQLSDDKKNNDNLKVYTRVGDKLKIGDANIEKIYYFFYKNRFCRTLFYFNSTSVYCKIKETLFHAYGKIEVKMSTSPSSLRTSSTYLWVGKKVKLELDYYERPFKTTTDLAYKQFGLVQKPYNVKKKEVKRYPGTLSVFYKPIWNEEISIIIDTHPKFIFDRTANGVEFRRFFFHLFGVIKPHATSSQNRCPPASPELAMAGRHRVHTLIHNFHEPFI